MHTRLERMSPVRRALLIAGAVVSGVVALLILAYVVFAAVIDWILSSLTW